MKKLSSMCEAKFSSIGDDQIKAVVSIAKACFSKIGMEAVGKSRLPRWEMGLPFWDEANLREHLQLEDRFSNVMSINRTVVGYQVCRLRPNAVEIEQVAIDPDYWRNGYATQLIVDLKQTTERLGKRIIGLKVAEGNLGAQLLFRENGFQWRYTHPGPLPGQQHFLMSWRQSTT